MANKAFRSIGSGGKKVDAAVNAILSTTGLTDLERKGLKAYTAKRCGSDRYSASRDGDGSDSTGANFLLQAYTRASSASGNSTRRQQAKRYGSDRYSASRDGDGAHLESFLFKAFSVTQKFI